MDNIRDFLTQDHRRCDELFALVEKEAMDSLSGAKEICENFVKETQRHFDMEEMVMFVEFEAKTGIKQGPTVIMKHEHSQMRNLMKQMLEAIDADDKDKFFGLSETLMILLQQHNMKEEQMLYPMAQQYLSAEAQKIVKDMESLNVN